MNEKIGGEELDDIQLGQQQEDGVSVIDLDEG